MMRCFYLYLVSLFSTVACLWLWSHWLHSLSAVCYGEQQAHSYRTGYSCTEKTNRYSKNYPAVLPACLFSVVVSERNFFFFLLRLASQGILDLRVFVVTLRMYEAEGVALSQYWRNKKDPEGIEG